MGVGKHRNEQRKDSGKRITEELQEVDEGTRENEEEKIVRRRLAITVGV